MLRLPNNALKLQARQTSKRAAKIRSGLGLKLQSFTVAELTAAGLLASQWPGALVAVSNGAAGSACLAYSNGTAWKRVDLGITIAAS